MMCACRGHQLSVRMRMSMRRWYEDEHAPAACGMKDELANEHDEHDEHANRPHRRYVTNNTRHIPARGAPLGM
jgi:hypothetical protein